MNMQVVTPLQKQLSDAHKVRLQKFWPATTKPKQQRAMLLAPPVAAAQVKTEQSLDEWFKLAWDILDPSSSDTVTIDTIKREVCAHFGVTHNELVSHRRSPTFSTPRMCVMYLSKHLTSKCYPEIGRHLANRDHTTILHGVGRIKILMERDERLAASVEFLMNRLSA